MNGRLSVNYGSVVRRFFSTCTPIRQSGVPAHRTSGQASTEMVFILPLMLALIGGGMFIVYSCWQGIKVQQAANVASRIQGQERVNGGSSPQSIQDTNGVGVDMTLPNGEEDPTESDKPHYRRGSPDSKSVYGRLHKLVHNMFDNSTNVFVPPPVIGQNVDRIKVIRVINIPKIPFLNLSEDEKQIKLVGTAWGGEDTLMYGLPRWGKTSTSDLDWRQQVGNNAAHDE